MPQVIPFIISWAGTAAGLSAATTAVLTLASTIAVGYYEQQRARSKARNAFNASLQDRVLTIRSAVAPRNYVLGEVRTGGALLNIQTANTIADYMRDRDGRSALDSVVAFACNQCEVIGYYIGDEFIDDPGDLDSERWGNAKPIDQDEWFDVTGPSASVTLTYRPADGYAITAAGTSTTSVAFTGALPVSLAPTGTVVTISGIPAGAWRVLVNYKISSAEKLLMQFRDGAPDQLSTSFLMIGTPYWTENHRLRGVCHVRTMMIWDENAYPNGAPSINAILRGKWIDGHPFFDPRDNSNPAYTNNPALLAAWWMTLPRLRGGMGIPSTWIDWGSVAAAANVCDEPMTVRTLDGLGYEQIPRYRCDTLVSTETSPIENLEIILSAMSGRRVFTAGKYRIVAGAYRSATSTIRDGDVIGDRPMSTSTSSGQDAPPNIVTAKFADRTQHYTDTSAPPVRNGAYIAADGYESPFDISLPAVTDPRRANYLMGVTLESLRPAMSVALTVGGFGEDIALLDTLMLEISNRPAYSGKTFEVVSIADHWDGTFDLTLREIRPQTWALDPDTFTPTNPAPPVDLSYLWQVASLDGFSVDLGEPQTLPDGNSVTRATLRWERHSSPHVQQGGRIEVRYREIGQEWTQVGALPGDSIGTEISASLIDEQYYQFQVRAVNGFGAVSGWRDQWAAVEGTELAVGVAGPGIFTWANPVNVTTTSSSVTKSGGAAAWDAGAHSLQSYTGGSFVSARCGQLGTRRMIALNGDPAVDAGYLGLDYALHVRQDNTLAIYESGLLVSTHGACTVDTIISIKYDNANIVYEKDGTPIRTIAAGANRRFFLDVSLFEIGATLVDISFGPMGGIGPQGLPGVAAQSVRLTASSQAFTYNSAGTATPAGQTITFTAVRQNIVTAAVWTAVANDGTAVTLTGSGDSRTLTAANFGTKTWVRVRAESTGFFDEITAVRLTQGANGVSAIQAFLTNQNHTLAANPDGVVGSYANANGQLFVYDGTTDVTTTATLSIASQTGCTVQLNTAANTPVSGQPKGFYRVTAITADQASAVLRAVMGSNTRDLTLTLTRAREGQPGDGQNLLPVGDWVVGTSGSQGPGNRWGANGVAAESAIVLGGAGTAPLGPFGTSEVLWECRPSGNSDGDGGWNVNVPIDHRLTYRSTVWFRVNQLSGNFYHGCAGGDTYDLGGGANLNPYFMGVGFAGNLLPNKWYLSVGVLHGSGYTGGNSGIAGIYDPDTGRRIFAGNEYRNSPTATSQTHRCYHFYDTSTVTRQWMPKPRLEEINGSEPTIDALLGFQRTIPWIETGNCYASTTSFFKVGGTSNWTDDSARSVASYRTFHLQFKPGTVGGYYYMVGANSDPAADASYVSIDFAWYPASGALQIYENSVYIGEFGTYTQDTELAITGDGSFVRYYKDRVLMRTVAAAAVPYGLDSSLHTPGAQVNSVRFGPGVEFETISTGEIAPNAATEILETIVIGPVNISAPYSGIYVGVGGYTRPVSVVVTAIGRFVMNITHAVPCELAAHISVGPATPSANQPIGSNNGTALSVKNSFSLEQRFILPAMFSAAYYINFNPSFSAPAHMASTVTLHNVILKAEVIKL